MGAGSRAFTSWRGGGGVRGNVLCQGEGYGRSLASIYWTRGDDIHRRNLSFAIAIVIFKEDLEDMD
jgi:hypothetical protein